MPLLWLVPWLSSPCGLGSQVGQVDTPA